MDLDFIGKIFIIKCFFWIFNTNKNKSSSSAAKKKLPVKEESVLVINRDGDSGKSKLLSGKIIEKHHSIFHALGHTDELLCNLG